jgi:hypothetical protein
MSSKLSLGAAFLSLTLLFTACGSSDNEDIVQAPSKEGAVHTTLKVVHDSLSSSDILITTHTVYTKKGDAFKNIVHRDTVPNLGMTTQEGEDKEGNTARLTVPRDYELYITVQ